MTHVMDHIMAAARNAGKLVRLNCGKRRRISIVGGAFLEGTRAEMAMETLPVIERFIELDVLRQRRCSQVVDVKMS